MRDQPYLLGIDIGTYSAKGVLVDHNGLVYATHTVEYELSIPRPGWAEHDANTIWWEGFIAITQAILQKSKVHPREIAAVGCSTIGPTMLPVDRNGNPLRPAILYGIDTRSWKEVEELTNNFDTDEVFLSTGKPITTQSNGTKILWFRKNEPQLFKQTHKILTASGYLAFKLTGRFTVDIYTAAAFDPMFDIPTLDWHASRVATICPQEMLPELHASEAVVGEIHAEAARTTGLKEGTPVIAGTIDAAAEAISVGVTEPGDTMLMYGTTLFIIHVAKEWLRHKKLWSSPYVLPDRYVLAGGLSTSAALTRWFRDQFAQDEITSETMGRGNAYEALARSINSIPAGSNGLLALPYFSGERTPINDPKARGVILGLSLSHTKAHIYKALLEGVGYALRQNLEVMEETGTKLSRLVAVGGGTKNKQWLQIISDCIGRPQEIPTKTIGASYGDAFLAGLGVGIFKDYAQLRESWVVIDSLVEPIPANRQVYDEMYPAFLRTYEKLKDEMHLLADRQR